MSDTRTISRARILDFIFIAHFVNFLKGKNFEVQNVRNSEKMEIFSRFFEESDKDFLGAILFQSR